MSKRLAAACVTLILAGACAPKEPAPQGHSLANPNVLTGSENPPPRPGDVPSPLLDPQRPVAMVNGQPITADQLHRPLVEAHGLKMLLYLVQLEMAKQKAREAGLIITPEAVAQERQRTLDGLFKASISVEKLKGSDQEKEAFRQKEYERLLNHFLDTQRLSLQEFELAVETSAYLRKLAEPGLREQISEEILQDGFRIKYGERIRVRHIQVANPREWAEARRRVDAGEPFEKVAAELSQDEQTRKQGGLMRIFSRAERTLPEAFKTEAFALKEPGELSGPVQAGGAYHLIKLEEKFPPNKAVKYEDHREILREELYNLMLNRRVGEIRQDLVMEARRLMTIQDPVLKRQYQAWLDRSAGEVARDADQVRKEIELDNAKAPPTQPSPQPSPQPVGAPEGSAGRPEVARPPATRPGI